MTEQEQQTEKQDPISIQLSLNLDQVNFILGALGKLPTESGAWIVRQIVGQQAQQQVETLQTETTKETPTVQ
jgi:hypothetical protein